MLPFGVVDKHCERKLLSGSCLNSLATTSRPSTTEAETYQRNREHCLISVPNIQEKPYSNQTYVTMFVLPPDISPIHAGVFQQLDYG
ncbi:hypothetical protein EXN66_Car006470 [Channa argus]|uniref:Uncharacterized protein n=1 Tax=Channa argus TaxID=215402 RepID=A0A6G1PLB5_CHAAH|nr:hypothetical protein EXN66_Car006470 [Channa argus]